MKKTATSVALILILSVAGACGDDAEPADDAVLTTTSAATATTTQPTAGKVSMIDVGVDLPIGVIEFGDAMDDAAKKLTATLGPPTEDTGLAEPRRPYGKCPGTKVRALRYYGGALELLFGDAGEKSAPGKFVFHSWVLTSTGTVSAAPKASVLIGDVTTFDFRVGTTVKEFERGLADPGGYSFETFDSVEGTTTFVISNEEAGNDPPEGAPVPIRGELTSDADTGTAKLIEAGAGCSE